MSREERMEARLARREAYLRDLTERRNRIQERRTGKPTPKENKATSGPPENKGAAGDLEEKTVAELSALAEKQGVEVKGTGKGGNVLKADLIKALG
jgi:hypothetical protein